MKRRKPGRAGRPAAKPKTGGPPGNIHGPLERIVETMQLGVTITDAAGQIQYVNPADAAMHGYTVAELIGQDVGVYA